MQINGVSGQNFGMALRIKPSAKDFLRNINQKERNKIAQAGRELKNTKYWDMEIQEAGKPCVISKDRSQSYYPPYCISSDFTSCKDGLIQGKALAIGCENPQAYETVRFYTENRQAVRDAHKKISYPSRSLDSAVEFTKILEKSDILKEQAKIQRDNATVEIDNLYSQYGKK